jgi:hypothetical protein
MPNKKKRTTKTTTFTTLSAYRGPTIYLLAYGSFGGQWRPVSNRMVSELLETPVFAPRTADWETFDKELAVAVCRDLIERGIRPIQIYVLESGSLHLTPLQRID